MLKITIGAVVPYCGFVALLYVAQDRAPAVFRPAR